MSEFQNQSELSYGSYGAVSERETFLKKTYLHLAGALLAFTGLEVVIFNMGDLAARMTQVLFGTGFGWLLVLGLFMGVSYVATKWASGNQPVSTQYMGLGLYVVAEALIFVPLLYMATYYAPPGLLGNAVVLTLCMFAGLTFIALTSKKDFSFLGGALRIAGFVALGMIVSSIIFGFTLGVIFSGLMILFASAAILYNTSAVLRDFDSRSHVAASLTLFASVALLFWYILQMLMSLSSDD